MTDAELPLDLPEPVVDPDSGLELSAGQRLTLRQKALVAAGIHPLRREPLHPNAPTDAAATDRGRPFTCGACAHRQTSGYGYPKCEISNRGHSVHTDVRAWWPACPSFDGGVASAAADPTGAHA